MAIELQTWKSLVEQGKYYQINNTKKVLYWDGEKWMRPVKDSMGKYDGWIGHLEKQPTNVKTVKKVDVSVIGYL